jgi:hypothetical protein
MVDVKNKVVFLRKSVGGIDKQYQLSSNIQGQLKKKIIKVKKIKTSEKISVELTGSYKEFEIKITPQDSKHAPAILSMLKVKR